MPKALLLDLSGAPESHHIVDGVPGLFHPTIPQPVGEGYAISEEAAAVYAADEGMPLKLVEITEEEAVEASSAAVTATTAALNQAPSSTVADRAAAAEQATAVKAAARKEKRA